MHPNNKLSFAYNFMLRLLFIVMSFRGASQKAMTFNAAENQGIRLTYLDSTYRSGLHSDSTKAVFGNKQEDFINAYRQLLQDLGSHLRVQGFMWGKETKCFNRIYFSQDGAIDFFLYNFYKDQISTEQEKVFDAHLNQFIKTYRFPLKADTKFSQCSPVRYNDKK
jgi:hypothetical protein